MEQRRVRQGRRSEEGARRADAPQPAWCGRAGCPRRLRKGCRRSKGNTTPSLKSGARGGAMEQRIIFGHHARAGQRRTEASVARRILGGTEQPAGANGARVEEGLKDRTPVGIGIDGIDDPTCQRNAASVAQGAATRRLGMDHIFRDEGGVRLNRMCEGVCGARAGSIRTETQLQ